MHTLSLVVQVSSVCLHFHPWSSACALVLECSLLPCVSLLRLQVFLPLFPNPAMVPDENSMEDPLCNSSFGSMVSLDYVTPDTVTAYTQVKMKDAHKLLKIPKSECPDINEICWRIVTSKLSKCSAMLVFGKNWTT